MTNEELAGVDELVGRLELGDLAAIPEAVTALQSLTATTREAEALMPKVISCNWQPDGEYRLYTEAQMQAQLAEARAENEKLREALGLIIENEGPDTGYGNSSAKIARAALKGSQQ